MCSKCSRCTPWSDGICDSCFWKSGPIFPAGITIDPRCVATCALRGHGTTANCVISRKAARRLGLRHEAARDFDSLLTSLSSDNVYHACSVNLVAAMGAELVRRLRERTCNEPG